MEANTGSESHQTNRFERQIRASVVVENSTTSPVVVWKKTTQELLMAEIRLTSL